MCRAKAGPACPSRPHERPHALHGRRCAVRGALYDPRRSMVTTVRDQGRYVVAAVGVRGRISPRDCKAHTTRLHGRTKAVFLFYINHLYIVRALWTSSWKGGDTRDISWGRGMSWEGSRAAALTRGGVAECRAAACGSAAC